MKNYKSPTERFIEAAGRTGDITLRWWYQHQKLEDMLSDKWIDQIADRVIERIKITADISEVIEAIDEIQKKFDEWEGKK